ncbi:MAG: peptidyl-prolyl cis-trans isomerase [Armatimonadota bacterium]
MKRLLVILHVLVTIGSLLGNVLLYRRYSTNRPVVQLSGGPVILKDFRDRLEAVSGRQVLTKMVMRKIVLDAAAKAGVTPSQDELQRRLDYIGRRRPQVLEDARKDPAKQQLMTEDLQTEVALESLAIKDVQVTPAEVEAFFKANGQSFLAPQQSTAIMVVTGNPVDATAAERMLREKDNAGLPRMDAATVARQPRLEVLGVNSTYEISKIPSDVTEDIKRKVATSPGGSVFRYKVGNSGPHQVLLVRVEKNSPGGVPKFAEIKPEVERACKLSKVQAAGGTTGVLLRLFKEADPKFEMPQYEEWFAGIRDAQKRMEQQAVPAGN